MTWVLLLVVAWFVVALVLAVVIGRGIRLAERRSEDVAPGPEERQVRLIGNVVADGDAVDPDPQPERPTARRRPGRRFRP